MIEADAETLRSVCRGLRLLFWAALISYLGPNLFGFALPFLGGRMSLLKWGGLIHTAASVPAAMGAFALASGVFDWRVLKIAALVNVIGGVAWSVSRFWFEGTTLTHMLIYIGDASSLIGLIFLLLVLIHLRRLSVSLQLEQLARSCLRVASAFVIVTALDEVLDLVYVESSIAVRLVPGVLLITIWVWYLILLRRIEQKVLLISFGKCLHCGYDLRGSKQRCSECGMICD